MNRQAAIGGFRHAAWFYRTTAEYRAVVGDFVRFGLDSGEPVLVAIPAARLDSGWTPRRSPMVTVAVMDSLGGNPARILPVLRAFADSHQGRRVRYVGEPAWPGRSAAELAEIARHEALINLAFADADISILCPYNAAELPPDAICDARGTHPLLLVDSGDVVNRDYLGPQAYPSCLGKPLLAPADAHAMTYGDDLKPMRAMVGSNSRQAGLTPPRSTDLVIAASEVAANTLRHTTGGGVVRLWATDDEVLCQFEDTGFIADPLAGHQRPAGDRPGGHGLWLVNQVCDLAEIRTSRLGTTIRLHMSRR